jgi:hypothetical protein
MFKIGDIITGNGSSRYAITTDQGTYRIITEPDISGSCEIKIVTHMTDGTDREHYSVNLSHFILVKTKLSTLIKRIDLGRKAMRDLIEHYNDDTIIKESGSSVEYKPKAFFPDNIEADIEIITEGE